MAKRKDLYKRLSNFISVAEKVIMPALHDLETELLLNVGIRLDIDWNYVPEDSETPSDLGEIFVTIVTDEDSESFPAINFSFDSGTQEIEVLNGDFSGGLHGSDIGVWYWSNRICAFDLNVKREMIEGMTALSD